MINSEVRLDKVLDLVATQATAVLDAEGASVLLLDPDRNELVFRAATGPKGRELVGERFDARLGIAGQALRTRRAVQVTDVTKNRNFFDGVDAKTHMQTRGLIAAPLFFLDQHLGVVEVINPRNRETFTDVDLELVQVFANLAAAAVRSGQAFDQITRDNQALRESIPSPRIIGASDPINRVMDLCGKVAASTATVLITGETGTGKELVARTIHEQSERRDKPMIAVNCAALSETLLESELFGHEKGAFTGADARKIGRFELADGGTLFLDELGEMAETTQVKLLRVLQEQEFVRVGGTQTIVCDVRIVAATNRDLHQLMQQGKFRDDLFYRINVFPIPLPALRDRIEDLPLLLDHFVDSVVPSLGVDRPRFVPDAMAAMLEYPWPGNIRELRNVIERCTLLAGGGEVTLENLPLEIANRSGIPEPQASAPAVGRQVAEADPIIGASSADPAGESVSKLASHEKAMILQALSDNRWNQSAAARALGITRDHLRYRVKKYGISKPG